MKIDTFSIDEMEEVSDNNTSDKLVESALDFSNYEFLADDWRYVLINKQHPIPDDYTFTLGTIKGDMQCDERVLKPLFSMLQAAKQDGVTLVICSPYRDMKKQESHYVQNKDENLWKSTKNQCKEVESIDKSDKKY